MQAHLHPFCQRLHQHFNICPLKYKHLSSPTSIQSLQHVSASLVRLSMRFIRVPVALAELSSISASSSGSTILDLVTCCPSGLVLKWSSVSSMGSSNTVPLKRRDSEIDTDELELVWKTRYSDGAEKYWDLHSLEYLRVQKAVAKDTFLVCF